MQLMFSFSFSLSWCSEISKMKTEYSRHALQKNYKKWQKQLNFKIKMKKNI